MNKALCSFILCATLMSSLLSFGFTQQTERFKSGDKQVAYEVFKEASDGPVLIMLHGASGPEIPLYRQQADFFASKGYTVLLLHYFDATGSSAPSDKNYALWARAVSDLVRECRSNSQWSGRKIALLGFSLGASVALAAGSQRVPVNAIADWYGSLPDAFFEQRKGMPPLLILHGNQDQIIPMINAQQLIRLCEMEHHACESHFYADQGHGFTDTALKDADNRTLDFFSRQLK
jgi:carboxymethylenebutenolidase